MDLLLTVTIQRSVQLIKQLKLKTGTPTLGAHARRGLYVCPFSVFCLLALLGIQQEVSVATVWKKRQKENPFSLKLLSSKVRSVINLPRLW